MFVYLLIDIIDELDINTNNCNSKSGFTGIV